jgi:hypothetical protein
VYLFAHLSVTSFSCFLMVCRPSGHACLILVGSSRKSLIHHGVTSLHCQRPGLTYRCATAKSAQH